MNLAVVAVEAQIGDDQVRSSGVVLDADEGLILTSAHTLWGATSLRVATGLGVLYGRIVARAPCDDLAVVEAQPRLPGLVVLEPAADEPAAEDLLLAVGRREASPDVATGSLVTIPSRAVEGAAPAALGEGLPGLNAALRLDGALVPESSGGPVVDSRGRLVGLALATGSPEQPGGLAIPWSAVKERLQELRQDARRLYVGWREQYRCADRLHAYAETEHAGYRRVDARINAPVAATRLPGTETVDAE